MVDTALLLLGWFTGGFINGIAGFGAAIIAMPFIAPSMDLSVAVSSCTLIILTLNVQVCWTFRRDIEWVYVKEIFWGAIPGVFLSVYILEYLSESHLKMAMGLFIICYAIWSLLSLQKDNKTLNSAWGYLSGFLSSTLGMAFGFNGPPLAAYIAGINCHSRAAKGLLGAGFIVTGIFIVSGKAMTGQITNTVLLTYAMATPAVIVGSKLGISLSARFNEKSYRKILLIALAAMGLNIIWSAWSHT